MTTFDKYMGAGYLSIGVFAILLGLVLSHSQAAHANVTDHGLPSRVATTSPMVVGPQAPTTLFATSSACSARIITTYANPVTLSFNGQLVPTALVGHIQAASTTVAYDNLTYGCGAVVAYGFTASTSITVTGLIQ